jgi:Ca-activated chloride channel family protein
MISSFSLTAPCFMHFLLRKFPLLAFFLVFTLSGTCRVAGEEERPPVALKADVQATAGSDVLVHWQGYNRPGDFLVIVAPEATVEDYRLKSPITENPVKVRAPRETGVFQIRYVTDDHAILGTRALRLSAAEVDLYLPNRIPLGQLIEITWYGPDEPGDFLAIAAKDAEPGSFVSTVKTSTGSPTLMRAPDRTGSFVLKYISAGDDKALGSIPMEILPPDVWLRAPLEALRGSDVMVDWEGPNDPGDRITIVPKDAPEGTVGPVEKTSRGSPARIRAPMTLGEHEIRYISGKGNITYSQVPIILLKEDVFLDVPARATRGSKVTVVWRGPDNFGDYVIIVPEGAPEGEVPERNTNLSRVSRGDSLLITAPMTLGTHEVRYVNGETHMVLGRAYVDLEDAPVTLRPPETVSTNEKFQIPFVGPGNAGDYITIKASNGRFTSYTSRASATDGSPVTIIAPSTAGDYEVQYINPQDNLILKKAPIKVVDPDSADTARRES